MFSAAVITCVFWFTEECHVDVLREIEIPGIGNFATLETETVFTSGPSMATVSEAKPEPNSSALDESDYDSYFGFDMQALVQDLITDAEKNEHYDGKVDAQNFQQPGHISQMPHKLAPSEQEDADVRMAQKYFNEMLGGGSYQTPYKQDNVDVSRAQKYFNDMLADGQQRTTTTSLSFLSKFTRFDGQACSLGKHEPLATFQVSDSSSNADPSLCARACLGVSGCSGFQILQFHALTYCDLLTTCTKDRLQAVPSKGLSTFLLNARKDVTSRPSFDYYYEHEAPGEYFIPLMILFAVICFALAACRIQRRRQLLAARAAAARKFVTVRGTPVDSCKDKDESDSEIIVIARPLELLPPSPPPQTRRARSKEAKHECQEF